MDTNIKNFNLNDIETDWIKTCKTIKEITEKEICIIKIKNNE